MRYYEATALAAKGCTVWYIGSHKSKLSHRHSATGNYQNWQLASKQSTRDWQT